MFQELTGDRDYKLRKVYKLQLMMGYSPQQAKDSIYNMLKLDSEEARFHLNTVLTDSYAPRHFMQTLLCAKKDGLSINKIMKMLKIDQRRYYRSVEDLDGLLASGFFQLHYYKPDFTQIDEVIECAKTYPIL